MNAPDASPDSSPCRLPRDGSVADVARRRPSWFRVMAWLSVAVCALGGMLLAAARFRSRFPWSYPEWTFWSVFGDLASMPVTGYGGVGLVLALPLLGAAICGVYVLQRSRPLVAAFAQPMVGAATGFLWMHLGDLVSSIGV